MSVPCRDVVLDPGKDGLQEEKVWVESSIGSKFAQNMTRFTNTVY